MTEPFSPTEWQRVSEIFAEIVELAPDERERIVREIADERTRKEVVELLAADDAAGDSFEFSPLAHVILGEDANRQIGNYRVLREIGRGGMGAVFLAVREDWQKQVALKIIKRGMDSEAILRRFLKERLILSRLEHPNIARLYDGGMTDDGLPYLVMEYVAGDSLIDYCEKNSLSINERLLLFRKVCAAVADAHQNLIVHRDLKPSNILVTPDGEPKLLDFGISKLLTDNDDDQTGTATALGMMTPAYASPEQKRGETVTTATDVYSLGLILGELVGCPSLVAHRGSPNKTDADAAKKTTNDERRTTNELSIIVNKARHEDAAQRYRGVEQLAEDLRRYAAGLPITARRDTFGYRAAKFARRNRAAVTAGAFVLFSLVAGIAGTTWQAVRAERQRILAEKRFEQARELADKVVFKYHDEVIKLSGATDLRQMMMSDTVQYLDNLAAEAADDQALQREMGAAYFRIGNAQGKVYDANSGDTAGAINSYRKAVELLEPLALKNQADAKLQSELSSLYAALGEILRRAGDRDEADIYSQKSLDVGERIFAANPSETKTAYRLAAAYLARGDSLLDVDRNQSAAAYQKSFDLGEKILAANPNDLTALHIAASLAARAGDNLLAMSDRPENLQQAAVFYNRSVEAARKLTELEPENALDRQILTTAEFNRSLLDAKNGDYDRALIVQRQTLRDFVQMIERDPNNQELKSFQAEVYLGLGDTFAGKNDAAQAIQNYQRASAIYESLAAQDVNNLELRRKRENIAVKTARLNK